MSESVVVLSSMLPATMTLVPGTLKLHLLPVFINLEFDSHEYALEAFERFSAGAARGVPIRVSWIKTKWYQVVSDKHRAWRLRIPDFESYVDQTNLTQELQRQEDEAALEQEHVHTHKHIS